MLYRVVSRTIVLSVILLAVACSPRQDRLQQILAKGKLTVVTRNAPTTWYEGREGRLGLEYDMAELFAAYLGVETEYVVLDKLSDILSNIKQGQGDLAAAGLTRTRERENGFRFGPTYQQVEQQVVCRRGGHKPKSVDDLAGLTLRVAADSSYAEHLQQLKLKTKELQWQTDDVLDTEGLLEQVAMQKLDCTVADSNIVAINRRYYPELSVRFAITEQQDLAWILPQSSAGLQKKLTEWFGKFKAEGKLDALLEKYYGFIEVFDYVDTRVYNRRIIKTLPHYRKMFEKAAAKYQLDWQLLAAQAYQESHWNPRAKSPTGVRGIMMLTRITAKEMGIKNRIDASQSIYGGAKYLSRLMKRIPETVEEPDRTWMALAAYNVGMGHYWDARRLAKQQNKKPDSWRDLEEVLPLLSQKRYYKKLKYGYARGREPVMYVQRIRDYHNILQQTVQDK